MDKKPLIKADDLQPGDHIYQQYTLTSHASIMVIRNKVHVGNMTQKQFDKVASIWSRCTGNMWGNRINLTIISRDHPAPVK